MGMLVSFQLANACETRECWYIGAWRQEVLSSTVFSTISLKLALILESLHIKQTQFWLVDRGFGAVWQWFDWKTGILISENSHYKCKWAFSILWRTLAAPGGVVRRVMQFLCLKCWLWRIHRFLDICWAWLFSCPRLWFWAQVSVLVPKLEQGKIQSWFRRSWTFCSRTTAFWHRYVNLA